MSVGGMKMTAKTENNLIIWLCVKLISPSIVSSKSLYILGKSRLLPIGMTTASGGKRPCSKI
jgi:hypothetical protein